MFLKRRKFATKWYTTRGENLLQNGILHFVFNPLIPMFFFKLTLLLAVFFTKNGPKFQPAVSQELKMI